MDTPLRHKGSGTRDRDDLERPELLLLHRWRHDGGGSRGSILRCEWRSGLSACELRDGEQDKCERWRVHVEQIR
jgi:hypothetical protein